VRHGVCWIAVVPVVAWCAGCGATGLIWETARLSHCPPEAWETCWALSNLRAAHRGKEAEKAADKAGDNLSGAAKDAQRSAEKTGDKVSDAASDAKSDVKRNL